MKHASAFAESLALRQPIFQAPVGSVAGSALAASLKPARKTRHWPQAAHRVLRNSTLESWESAGCPPSGRRPDEDESYIKAFDLPGREEKLVITTAGIAQLGELLEQSCLDRR